MTTRKAYIVYFSNNRYINYLNQINNIDIEFISKSQKVAYIYLDNENYKNIESKITNNKYFIKIEPAQLFNDELNFKR